MRHTITVLAFIAVCLTTIVVNAEQPLPQPKDTVIYSNDSTKADTLKYSPVINIPKSNVRGN